MGKPGVRADFGGFSVWLPSLEARKLAAEIEWVTSQTKEKPNG